MAGKELLNAKQIAAAKPKQKEYNLADGGGLNLRIKPTGLKIFLLNYYRPYSKKRANLKIGSFPETSLKQAREKRRQYAALLDQNIDPQIWEREQLEASKQIHEQTFEKVAYQWLKKKREKVTPDYGDDIERSLKNHVFPHLGKFPISKLTAPQVIQELRPLEAKGSLETLRRICQRVNEIMTYAVNCGIVFSNPLAGINAAFSKPIVQHQPTIKPEELPEFLKKLSRASIKFPTRCLIEFKLHTLARPGEGAGARWDEIDMDNKLWIIPAKRMKMRNDHVIPLSTQVINLLEEMKPISGRYEFVFPGDRNPKKPTNSQTANMAIKRMGYTGKLVGHGLRSIGSTVLNEQGFDPDVIESALSHEDKNEVRRAYNRSQYLERRRAMMQWWSDYIEAASKGLALENKPENVVHLKTG